MKRGMSLENGEIKIAYQENIEEFQKDGSAESKGENQENDQENAFDFEEMERQYALRDSKVEDALKEVKDSIEINDKGIKAALKGASGLVDVAHNDSNKLLMVQEKAEKKIKEMEDNALEVPKGKEGEVLSAHEFERDISKIIEGLEEDARELLKNSEIIRKEFVEKQIEESIKEAGLKYKNIFHDRKTLNGINAEKIIKYKIEKEMRAAANEFIMTGDEASFGIVKMAVRVSSFKEGDEGSEVEKEYVTGFVIDVGGYVKKIGERYSPEGYPLLAPTGRKKIEDKRGEIKRKLV